MGRKARGPARGGTRRALFLAPRAELGPCPRRTRGGRDPPWLHSAMDKPWSRRRGKAAVWQPEDWPSAVIARGRRDGGQDARRRESPTRDRRWPPVPAAGRARRGAHRPHAPPGGPHDRAADDREPALIAPTAGASVLVLAGGQDGHAHGDHRDARQHRRSGSLAVEPRVPTRRGRSSPAFPRIGGFR